MTNNEDDELPPPAATVLVPMVMYMSLSVAVEITYASWIFTLAEDQSGFSPYRAAYLTSSFWASFTAGRFGWSLAGAHPLTAILWSYAVAMTAIFGLIAYWGGALAWVLPDARGGSGTETGLLWGVTIAFGFGTAGMFPNGIALGRRMFPLTGVTQALFELGAATGSGAGPYVAAWVYRKHGGNDAHAHAHALAVPLTCAASGLGALVVLGVACACCWAPKPNWSWSWNWRKRRETGAKKTEAEIVAATDSEGGLHGHVPLIEEGGENTYEGRDGDSNIVSLRQPLLRWG